MSPPSHHNICPYKSCRKKSWTSRSVAHPTDITIPTIPSPFPNQTWSKKGTTEIQLCDAKPAGEELNKHHHILVEETQPQVPQGRFDLGRRGHVHEIVIGKSLQGNGIPHSID